MTFDFGQSLQIDDVLTLPCRALASPLEGLMTDTFCAAADDLNLLPNWITPFFSVAPDSVPSARALKKWMAPFRNNSGPLIVQLLGHEAETLAETARILAETGVRGINLNFACPSRTVTGSRNGAAMLKDPDRMEKIVKSVSSAIHGKASLSLKLRTGWSDPAEFSQYFPRLRDAGIPWIILHFRTAAEMYHSVNDPLPRLIQAVQIAGPACKVFGNGDIASYELAEQMVRVTGCDGVAVGRALFHNPFLLKNINSSDRSPVSDSERFQLLQALIRTGQKNQHRLNRGWIIECIRMAFGKDHPLCLRAVHAPLDEILDLIRNNDR